MCGRAASEHVLLPLDGVQLIRVVLVLGDRVGLLMRRQPFPSLGDRVELLMRRQPFPSLLQRALGHVTRKVHSPARDPRALCEARVNFTLAAPLIWGFFFDSIEITRSSVIISSTHLILLSIDITTRENNTNFKVD